MRAADRTTLGTAAALTALAGAASAAPETYDCLLSRVGDTMRLRFSIDRATFSPPLDSGEPPRRQISRVTQGRATYDAEALLTEDGTLGFWSQDRQMMLTRSPEGAARLTVGNRAPWTGRCEEIS